MSEISQAQAGQVRFIENAEWWIECLRERELHGIAAAFQCIASERDALRAELAAKEAELANRHEAILGLTADAIRMTNELAALKAGGEAVERRCTTCKHDKVHFMSEPCVSCVLEMSADNACPRWEPTTPQPAPAAVPDHCVICDGTGWVCENCETRWELKSGETCCGAGKNCVCNKNGDVDFSIVYASIDDRTPAQPAADDFRARLIELCQPFTATNLDRCETLEQIIDEVSSSGLAQLTAPAAVAVPEKTANDCHGMYGANGHEAAMWASGWNDCCALLAAAPAQSPLPSVHNHGDGCVTTAAPSRAVLESVLAAPAQEKAEDGWIDVNDRLPEHKQVVAFVVDQPNSYMHGRVLGGSFVDCGEGGSYFGVPGSGYMASHWMPLPDAPAALLAAGGGK